MRIDKFLKVSRILKRRTVAQEACGEDKVLINGKAAKPSTAVKIGEKLYTGLTNVGECPSFGKREYHTETFILDFSESVYEMEIKVYFLSFLREERVFSSSKELALQIEKDIAVAYKRKEEIKWQEIGLV